MLESWNVTKDVKVIDFFSMKYQKINFGLTSLLDFDLKVCFSKEAKKCQ